MIFLLILLLATAVAAAIERRRAVRSWARWGLAVALVVAGVTHLVAPTPFEQHLPEWVPAAGALVAITGLIEIALGAALVLWRSERRRVGVVVALYLLAVFPANIYVAVAGIDVEGQPGGAYRWIRLPFQVLFIAWALWSTRSPAPARKSRDVARPTGVITASRG